MSEETKTRDAQKKLLALCGDDESFVLDADGVSPALLCATRVAASGSSDLEDAAGDWNPAKPLSEVNERKALASLEETFEIILNSYPTSDIEDEALLDTLKGSHGPHAAEREVAHRQRHESRCALQPLHPTKIGIPESEPVWPSRRGRRTLDSLSFY